ncbi:MAG: putative bifunctional diguanylate cyclase/phosphodiesterase [Nocardioides sp.]
MHGSSAVGRAGLPIDLEAVVDTELDAAGQLQRLETIFRLAPVGIGIVDLDGQTIMSNDTLRQMLGYTAEEFATMSWTEFTYADDVARNIELFRQMAVHEIDQFHMEKRFICRDGSLLWASLTSSMVYGPGGAPDYVIGMVQDITDRKRLERELRAAEQRYRMLVERVPAVVYIAEVGPRGRWHYVGPQIEEMLGFTAEEWMGDPDLWCRQLHPDDRERAIEEEQLVADGAIGVSENKSMSYRMLRRDGSWRWVRDDAMPLEQDGVLTWHGVLVDVTREKHLEQRLSHQAFHDSLTGLPNRRLFHDRVDQALERIGEVGGSAAVLFVDLDDFKTVNDSFGHGYGDQVIVTAAGRILDVLGDDGMAARLGGDEFALLVEGRTPDELSMLADRLLIALRSTPMRLGEVTVTVAGSIGIAAAAPGDTTETLLRNADLAMYRAKKQGRGRHVRYHAGLHDEVINRFLVEEALQAAVAEDRITLAYQPIVEVATGAVSGLEALARWTDPELGVVPPAEFIAVAEQTGLIKELGQRVIEQACKGLVEWRAATGAEAYVSVNVSPLQLDDDFPAVVDRVLAEHGLAPSALVLEVTEGLMMVERSRKPLHELRARGIRVAIDDFGTGFSSLSYLRELPVDMIKIDQVFLRPGPGGAQDQTLLHAIIQLAGSLHLPAICEGVETGEQLADLGVTGCHYAQGYLVGRPGPLADIPAVIEAAADR